MGKRPFPATAFPPDSVAWRWMQQEDRSLVKVDTCNGPRGRVEKGSLVNSAAGWKPVAASDWMEVFDLPLSNICMSLNGRW